MAFASMADVLTLIGEHGLDDRDSAAKQRFRNFLQQTKWQPEDYETWVEECLDNGGREHPAYYYALQDVMVSVGTALGTEVEYGPYSSASQQTPWDGRWFTSNNESIIVEVKCSAWPSASAIQLSTYLEMFAGNSPSGYNGLYGLYVVGRGPIQQLIEKIKGGDHRNRVKVITCSDLLRLWRLKRDLEASVGPQKAAKLVQGILLPFESVNVGCLLDVIQEVAARQTAEQPRLEPAAAPSPIHTGHIAVRRSVAQSPPVQMLSWQRDELFDFLDVSQPIQIAMLMVLASSTEPTVPAALLAHRMQIAAAHLPHIPCDYHFNGKSIGGARSGFSKRARMLDKEGFLDVANARYRIKHGYVELVREWLGARDLGVEEMALIAEESWHRPALIPMTMTLPLTSAQ